MVSRISLGVRCLCLLTVLAACGAAPTMQTNAPDEGVAVPRPLVFDPTEEPHRPTAPGVPAAAPEALSALTETISSPVPPEILTPQLPRHVLLATVARSANVRNLPTTTGSTVLGQVERGTIVRLRG